jgi:hypothetical protein
MAEYTLTYSPTGQGWTSFHSYKPEWMIGMNSYFYSFYRGNIYKHYSNAVRNNYYGAQYSSKITPVFNTKPTDNKMFKTIGIESNAPWDTTITTDLSTGFMSSSQFNLREGDYYTYIRRVAGNIDLALLSSQGIGEIAALGVAGAAPGVITLTFAINIPSVINVGDILYRDNGGVVQEIGAITAISGTTITMNVTVNTPSPADLCLAIKNAQAESFGARGYYMEVVMENSLTSEVELFAVFSDVFKSLP